MKMITPLTKTKIFIVDDSPIVVERLTLMLNDMENTIVAGHAHTISSALTSIKEIEPDVIILDIHLKDDAPHLNGIDLLSVLRLTYPKMLILMLTNHSSAQYIRKCIELGADYFLDKSNDFERIPEILRKNP